MSSTSQPCLERSTSVGALNPCQKRRLEVLAHHLIAPPREEWAALSSSLMGQPVVAKENGEPVVVGGMVLDIHACPVSNEIRPGTTIPGEVHYVRGGVGRNIAECLAKLGQRPFLISVVGDDMAGDSLLTHWRSLGLSLDGIRKCVGMSTPVVSAVFDARGELAAAVADTQAVGVYLTPDWIKRFTIQIQAAPVVMLDANLHPLALKAACKLASDAGVPIWFEPVSIAKATRATGLLKSIKFVSPNEAELIAMAEALHPKKKRAGSFAKQVGLEEGSSVRSVRDILSQELQGPIREVLGAGVKYIVLTLGSEGAVLCSTEPLGQILYYHYRALPASVVKLSGAGDCLVAGTLAALSRKLVEPRAVAYGLAAAKLAVESEMNVPEQLSWDELSGQWLKYLITTQIPELWSHAGCLQVHLERPTSEEACQILTNYVYGRHVDVTPPLQGRSLLICFRFCIVDAIVEKGNHHPLVLANMATNIIANIQGNNVYVDPGWARWKVVLVSTHGREGW